MVACLQSNPRTFHAGETAYTYGSGDGQTLGLVQEGQAVLVKIDARGSRTILERLGPGGIFGEGVAFASLPCDSVTLVCETACTVLFLPRAKLAAPCAKACGCHHQLLENLLGLLSHKAFALSERVEVLSCRSIREKLLCTFRICAFEAQSLRFTLPFSLSALAIWASPSPLLFSLYGKSSGISRKTPSSGRRSLIPPSNVLGSGTRSVPSVP